MSDDPFARLGGGVWFLQIWLFYYFPKLRSPEFALPLGAAIGIGLMSYSTKLSNDELLSFFRSPNLSAAFMFIPCDGVPSIEWLEEYAKFEKLSLSEARTKLKIAFTASRSFIIGGCSSSMNATISYRPYWPCLWGRQFGYEQCIPDTLPKPPTMISKNFLDTVKQQNSNLLDPLIKVPFASPKAFLSWWASQYKEMVPLSLDAFLSGNSLFF